MVDQTVVTISPWDIILHSPWVIVALIAIVLVLVLFIAKRNQTKILKDILLKLVTEAEQMYKSGSLKFSAVAEWIYGQIPGLLKILFTESNIRDMIEEVLEAAKELWKTDPNIEFNVEPDDPEPAEPEKPVEPEQPAPEEPKEA